MLLLRLSLHAKFLITHTMDPSWIQAEPPFFAKSLTFNSLLPRRFFLQTLLCEPLFSLSCQMTHRCKIYIKKNVLPCSNASVKTALDRYLRAAPIEYLGGMLSTEELLRNPAPTNPAIVQAMKVTENHTNFPPDMFKIKLRDDWLALFNVQEIDRLIAVNRLDAVLSRGSSCHMFRSPDPLLVRPD